MDHWEPLQRSYSALKEKLEEQALRHGDMLKVRGALRHEGMLEVRGALFLIKVARFPSRRVGLNNLLKTYVLNLTSLELDIILYTKFGIKLEI